MALGLGSMRLHPKAFWAMTPREFAFAAGLAGTAAAYPDRASVAALMRRYPDVGKGPARA